MSNMYQIVIATIIQLPINDIRYDYVNPDIRSGDMVVCKRYFLNDNYVGTGEDAVAMCFVTNGRIRLWSTLSTGFSGMYTCLIVIRPFAI